MQTKPPAPVIEQHDGPAIPRKSDRGLVSAWWLSLAASVGTLLYLVLVEQGAYLRLIKFVPDGVLITFQVTVFSLILALFIGLLTGLGRVSRNRWINLVASTYVEIIRGIPLLVQLFYIYYALGRFVRVPDMVAAVIAMAVCYGAYLGEIFRAGILAIDKGQTEAARSLGFSRAQTMRYVILPQAMRIILPPVGNEFIMLLKDTSLVSILAVADLLRRGREFASETFMYFETYTVVALIYLIITLLLSKMVSMLEERLSYYVRK
jgi:polar amino acid transport system permease protein